MVEEGEFKKRFDAKAISGQDVEWQMVALKYVHDVIDEFKKEFPNIDLYTDNFGIFDKASYDFDMKQWFVKWFGSESSPKIEKSA